MPCVCTAIGRQSVDVVSCPYLTPVSDSRQLNAESVSEQLGSLATVNISRSLPVGAAAGQLQLDTSSSVAGDQQCHLLQYPLAELSSVLDEQTLVGSTLCADTIQITQYPLSDSSSDGSRNAAEPRQYPIDDSPDSVTTALRHDAAAMVSVNTDVKLEEDLSVQHSSGPVQNHSSSPLSADSSRAADQRGSGDTVSDTGAANQLEADQEQHDRSSDLLVSANVGSLSCCLPATQSAALSSTGDPLNKTTDFAGRYTAATSPSAPSHMKCTGVSVSGSETVSPISGPQFGVCHNGITVTDYWRMTSMAKDEIVGTVACLQSSCSSANAISLPAAGFNMQPVDGELLESARMPVGPGCIEQTVSGTDAVIGDGDDQLRTGLEMSPSQRAVCAVRQPADITDEVLDVSSSAAETLESIGRGTAAAQCGSVTATTDQSDALTHRHVATDDKPHHSCSSVTDTTRHEAEVFSPRSTETKSSGSRNSDLASEKDGDEFEDDLGEDVKMILAKYRIRRGPVGSDKASVASSAEVDTVVKLDVIDSELTSSSTRDLDTSSSSSDDTLASRVKSLLLKEHQDDSSKTLPMSTSNIGNVGVPSAHSSRSTPVDYNNLCKDLDEIQMNLDSMRSSDRSGLGSQQRSSSSLPHVCSQVSDEVMTHDRSRDVSRQRKTQIDELVQCSLLGRTGDGLVADHVQVIPAMSDVTAVKVRSLWKEADPQCEVSLRPPLNSIGTAESLIALEPDLDRDVCLQAGTDVQTREVSPLLSPSINTTSSQLSGSGTKMSDSYSSVPGQSLQKLLERFGSISELIGEVEHMTSSDGLQRLERVYGEMLPVDSGRDGPDSSAAECLPHDTVSEVSSLETDMPLSDGNSYTHHRSAGSQISTVEAAVKQLERNLSSVVNTGSVGVSPTSSTFSQLCDTEVLKRTPALYDDEYHLSEVGLSHSYSDSCSLSPVRQHAATFNMMKSVDPSLIRQRERTTVLHLGGSTQSHIQADSDTSSWQSSDRHVQQTENPTWLGITRETQYSNKTSSESQPYGENGRMQKSTSTASCSEQTGTFSVQLESAAHLQFVPLTQLPREDDSSLSASYDDDNGQPITAADQSYDRDVKLNGVRQQLTADSCDNTDVTDDAGSTQPVVSQRPAIVSLLQPYQ